MTCGNVTKYAINIYLVEINQFKKKIGVINSGACSVETNI